jgi:D-alanine-D-alanine ligase-like ATP-grasp enzyme
MLLQSEAIRARMRTSRFSPLFFSAASLSAKTRLGFFMTGSNFTSRWASAVCSNKHLTSLVLQQAGIRIPFGASFQYSDIAAANEFLGRLQGKGVLKPLEGGSGRAVSVGLETAEDLRKAHAQLRKGESFRVEEYVPGRDYRVLVCNGQVLSVVERVSARAVGNGASTIRQLIEQKNAKRLTHPRYRFALLQAENPIIATTIHQQGLSWESIPRQGTVVLLNEAANVSLGGEYHERVTETDTSITTFAVDVAEAVGGLGHYGVDLLLQDHRQPLASQPHAVCEVNSHSDITACSFPTRGVPINCVGAVFRHNAAQAGIPPGPPHDSVEDHLAAYGVNDVNRYVGWVAECSAALGVRVTQARVSGNNVLRSAAGETPAVAAVAAKAIRPTPALAAAYVDTTPA